MDGSSSISHFAEKMLSIGTKIQGIEIWLCFTLCCKWQQTIQYSHLSLIEPKLKNWLLIRDRTL